MSIGLSLYNQSIISEFSIVRRNYFTLLLFLIAHDFMFNIINLFVLVNPIILS